MESKTIFSIIVFCSFQLAYSQKEGNNWYFGWKAGVTFNTSPPSALTNGQMSTVEGCATISTAEGRLLFYTDGISVWDSTHNVMPQGTGLKGDSSTSQSAIIVPYPDSSHLFYVFTLDDQHGNDGLHYSLVDMSLNSGKGAVVATKKNIKLKNKMCEKITAVLHANQHDYWVLVPQYGSDTFFAYSLTNAGLNLVPKAYATGFVIPGFDVSFKVGYIKVSPDRKKLAFTNIRMDFTAIGDFDASTGIISNVWRTYTPWGYGVEFSPGNKYLYVSLYVDKLIVQFDLSATSNPAFTASRKVVDSVFPSANFPGAMQLGPDGRIYFIGWATPYLHVLHAPDSGGLACRPQRNYIPLNSRVGRLGLPTYVPPFKRPIIVVRKCTNDSTFFRMPDNYMSDSARWDFGDPGSGAGNKSAGNRTAFHLYKSPGIYNVKVITYYMGFRDSMKVSFYVHKPVKPHIGKDTIICNAFVLNIGYRGSYRYLSYSWPATGLMDSTLDISQKGTYILHARDSMNCIGKDSIAIINPAVSAKFSLSDSVLCLNNHLLTAKDTSRYSDDAPANRNWFFGDGTGKKDSAEVRKHYPGAGVYQVKLVLGSSNNCRDSLSRQIVILPNPSAGFTVNNDTQCLPVNFFEFYVSDTARHYQWDLGDSNPSLNKLPKHKYLSAGTYKVYLTASDTSFCKSVDSQTLVILDPKVKITVDRDTQCFAGHEFRFDAVGAVDNYSWDFGDGSKGIIKNPKHSYQLQGSYKVRLNAIGDRICPVSDSVRIKLVSPSVKMHVDNDTQCLGGNIFTFSATPGKKKYLWIFGSGSADSGAAVQRNYTVPGRHTVLLNAVDSFSCTASDTLQLTVFRDPVSDFVFDINPCRKDVVFTNMSKNFAGSVWMIDTATFYTRNANYQFTNPGQVDVKLIVTDSSGLCRDTALISADVKLSLKQQPLLVPNVFTPGNDQLNECYQLGGVDASCGDKGEISIYNRWGLKVFRGDIVKECWNGKLNNEGEYLPAGVYYYMLDLKYYDEGGLGKNVAINGVIHLIR
jgi:gliding motility-associated-like protein